MSRITAEQLNAFIIPSVEIIEGLAKIPAQVGILRRQEWTIPPDTLIILIGLRGDLNGDILFQFDPLILTQILQSLIGNVPFSHSDPIYLDAMGEVANIIAGNATGRLEALGFQTTITPPHVLTGEDIKQRITGKEGIVIPIRSTMGEIGLSLFLEKK